MTQYKMISLSVNLGGRVVRKNQDPKIDGEKYPAVDIVAAEKAGFIEKIGGTDKQKPKADDLPEQVEDITRELLEENNKKFTIDTMKFVVSQGIEVDAKESDNKDVMIDAILEAIKEPDNTEPETE